MRGPAALALAAALVLAACDSEPAPDASATSATPAPAPVTALPEESAASDIAVRVDGVAPPTNRWYSPLAFGETGLPVFPKPLSFAARDGGFMFGLTEPTASERAIVAPARFDITVDLEDQDGHGVVTAANPVGATLSWADASVTLAQGWPVVGLTAHDSVTTSLSVAPVSLGTGVWAIDVGGVEYGVRVALGDIEDRVLTLAAGGTAQFFAVPDGGDALDFARALGDVPAAVDWSGSAGAEVAATTLTYPTATVVTLPAHRADDLDCDLGTYATINGPYAVCATDSVTWSVPAVAPASALDVAGLKPAEEVAIRSALASDIAATPDLPADSYFGGKALYRLANLLTLADALGETGAADALAATLETELRAWGDPGRCATEDARCFVYDPKLSTVVGHTPSFGSEEANDHHFHYGYLLYAAAVMAARDPALGEEIGAVFDLVAADIAGGAGGPMPEVRVFDVAEGHSWASGVAPFADGNNQESSSEAVAAWNAVALWADARGDQALGERARWMLAMEADAAARLWLAPDLSAFPDYGASIVALQWGAKRDYATWFSADPGAMLGIQIIPAAPVQAGYLSEIPGERIGAALDEAHAGGAELFPDYLLMYGALSGEDARQEAWQAAVDLPDDGIDDGNSRAYLLAWIAAAGD